MEPKQTPEPIPVFEDPVAYLGDLGIEAELVTVVDPPLAPVAA